MNLKCELLAPAGRAGDIPELIDAGADAIYVGLRGYSSRPASSDFSLEEIENALSYTKKAGVPLHVAVNAVIEDADLQGLCNQIAELDRAGIDALIVSDYGVLKYVRDKVEHAEIHMSTLTGIYNAENVKWLKEQFSVARIVLSSDLFLDEMVQIIDQCEGLDYEIVADGGICFNSNRQCLLPHYGEKEHYTVLCQHDFHILKDGESLKPAFRIGNCPAKIHRTMGLYLGMGISSFKMEGRTNALDYILKRLREMKDSKEYFLSHAGEIPGYMHYTRRSYDQGDFRWER